MITTIIPTFQRPLLLKKAIESILAQTYPHFKICIYDNASGDETEAVVKRFMEQDSRIFYHCHLENIGMMANYEFALAKIDTPFFSLLSDDDFLLPEFYALTLQRCYFFKKRVFHRIVIGVKKIYSTINRAL